MQTFQVIRTIKWIDMIIPDNAKRMLFGIQNIARERQPDPPNRMVEERMTAANQIGAAMIDISRNPDAVTVLHAFGLSDLLNQEIIIKKFTMDIVEREESEDKFGKLRGSYIGMIRNVEAWQKLTIPKDLQAKEPPDDFLTLNIIIPKSKSATVAMLSQSTSFLNDLYEAVAKVYNKKVEGDLVVVKIESGSSIRVDCKGLGDVVRHLKEFLLEAWHKIRHKRAEEVVEKNHALVSSLAIIDQIDSCVIKKSLSKEEAEALRRRVLKGAFGLFECGALIEEIPSEEKVDNTKLLKSFSPKLLPAPNKATINTTKKTTSKKRTVRKRAAKKQTKASTKRKRS